MGQVGQICMILTREVCLTWQEDYVLVLSTWNFNDQSNWDLGHKSCCISLLRQRHSLPPSHKILHIQSSSRPQAEKMKWGNSSVLNVRVEYLNTQFYRVEVSRVSTLWLTWTQICSSCLGPQQNRSTLQGRRKLQKFALGLTLHTLSRCCCKYHKHWNDHWHHKFITVGA